MAADLSGEALASALEGGLDLIKVDEDEVCAAGFAESAEEGAIRASLGRLHEAGAENVLVSRGSEAALALVGETELRIDFPRVEPIQPKGAGDSIFAAVAACRAAGMSWDEALRTGIAAGSLNVTRRGLGSGRPADIRSLADQVELVALDDRS